MRRLMVLLLLFAATAAHAQNPIRDWRQANERQILREFSDLLALPNIASDSSSIRANAQAIVAALERRGVAAGLLDGEGGPPPVYGELLRPGATTTLLFYAHYDGQPVVATQWQSDPWRAELRDQNGNPVELDSSGRLNPESRLYARSSSDDKGAIMAMLAALDALKAQNTRPLPNIKFFFEGEEEAGSPHLAAVLQKNAALLTADLMLLVDGPVHQSRRQQAFFGARGVMGLEMIVYGPVRTLHSGHYGNWAQNPAALLTNLLSSMRDARGRILISGFHQAVHLVTDAERKAIDDMPSTDKKMLDELGLARAEGDNPLAWSVMLPAINVRGFQSGAVGAATTNSIPTSATASLDFRLVPNQTPDEVRRQVEAHIRKMGFFILDSPPDETTRRSEPWIVQLRWQPGYGPHRTSLELPIAGEVLRVLDSAAGEPVVRAPILGGSVPMSIFAQHLKMPIIGVPIANHDNNQHADNENLRLQNLWDGIEVFAALMTRLGTGGLK